MESKKYYVKWFPSHHIMAHPQVEFAVDRHKIWKIATNTLIEHLQTAKKGWHFSSGVA
jgi:hypothetical protein